MRTVLMLFSLGILIAFADAQRKLNFSKPITNLENRPRTPVWNRPPEERRKLSLFPKTNLKFVVTPKTVKNDDATKDGLPTKRPLMRKFVMQDKNEKGTWSFAPREPLMKTKRFTVTLAPPKLNKEYDTIKADESKKVKAVISNPKTEQESTKNPNLNKGNLIQMMQNKKVDNSSASKMSEKNELIFVRDEGSPLLLERVNDTKDFDIIQMNDSKTVQIPEKNSEDFAIDERSLNDDKVISIANETKNEDDNAYDSVKFIEMPVTLNEEEDSKDSLESRAIDLSKIEFPIDQNENNSLIMNNEESNNHKTEQVLAFNDLEILLEKFLSNAEELNAKLAFDPHVNNSTSVSNSQTNDTLEDIPQFDVTKPDKFYEVISLDNDEDKNKKIKEEDSVAGLIVPDSLNSANDALLAVVSNTNELNNEKGFAENDVSALVMGNLESFFNLIDKDTIGHKTDDLFKDKLTLNQEESFGSNKKEREIDIVNTLTEKPNAPVAEGMTNIFTVNNTERDIQIISPGIFNDSKSTNIHSEEILLEVNASNRNLSAKENSTELVANKNSIEVSKESMMILSNLTLENHFDNTNVLTGEQTPGESISDTSKNYTEQLSNEPLTDISNNYTDKVISNESSSNMAAEELLNKSNIDKSNNFTEVVLNESIIETSNNFTGDEISNESSSNMAVEELSNESYVDKSNNLTNEVTNESIIETSNNFTGEEISNESLSKMALEELSNESYIDKSNNLTEEVSDESIIETSNNFTGEEISNESVSNMVVEELSNESYVDNSNNLTEELSNESIIESSNNFTGEEISNESSSNMAVEELSNESYGDKSNNLTEELPNESIIETSNNFTGDEISNESSSNMAVEELSNESYVDKSNNLTEDISNESVIESSKNLTGEGISNESSSNMAVEESSNESYVDKSNNLTEEVPNESVIGTSNNFTGEDVSDEWLVDTLDSIDDEMIPDESVVSSQDPRVEEISDEALRNRFKRSNNIIEEENLATTLSGFKYTSHVKSLNHDLSYKNINA